MTRARMVWPIVLVGVLAAGVAQPGGRVVIDASVVPAVAHLASVLLLLAPVLLAAGRAGRERAGVFGQERAGAFGRECAGAFLAFLTAALGIAILHELAGFAGWYGFAATPGAYRGMPVDLWLAWAALWGPIPVLLRRHLPVPVALGLLLGLDLVAMPALDPLVQLGPHWLHGEFLGLLVAALPAQALGRWTAAGSHLHARATLQMLLFVGLFLWLLPTVAFTVGDGSWHHLADPGGAGFLLVAALLGVPTVAAVREFAVRGGGTPFPFDPPVRLVTTGPYAYVANPMQVSMVAVLTLLAFATHSLALGAAAAGAVGFSVVIAARQERCDLGKRHGDAWLAYRRAVPDWLPRTRPYPGIAPARIQLPGARVSSEERANADDRGSAHQPLTAHQPPTAREILSTGAPSRVRYDADGYSARGVAAVGSAFDHLGLGWAYAGWILRLPVVSRLAQLITDVLTARPRPAGGTR